jgi:hypothetical protein
LVRVLFTTMCGAFGLCGDPNPTHFPGDRVAERFPRVDIRMLARCGGLVPGTTTELAIEATAEGLQPGRTANVCRQGSGVTIDGVLVRLSWDVAFGVERPWFECPICSRRCRHVYLRDSIACRRCHLLDYASRHLNRQMPALGRVERLRKRLGDCEAKPFAPLPTRITRGRSHAYHDRLVAMIHDEEAALLEHLGSIVHDLKRRIRVRKERHQW